MTQISDAKKRYDEIPIPEELSDVVRSAIDYSAVRKKKIRKRQNFRIGKRVLAAAAALAVVFTVGLNTSTAFAESMSELPVIGTIARVLTFRSYEKTTEDLSISVDIPSVEMIGEDSGLADALNEEICARCEEYAQEAIQRAEEYKEAFMATGGTEEEWAAHNIEIKVWYEIKSQTEQYLSFAVMGAENWVSAYNETRYYNLDLSTGKTVTLQDLLGDDYTRIADESIRNQMEERTAAGEAVFFTEAEGGFAGITENAKFYINEAGNPVVVFDQYEIAPGSEGMPEFEIVKE